MNKEIKNIDGILYQVIDTKLYYKGTLYIINQSIDKLPDNLVVDGDLIIHNCCFLKRIPHKLNVNGSLYINECNIKSLPCSLKVKK